MWGSNLVGQFKFTASFEATNVTPVSYEGNRFIGVINFVDNNRVAQGFVAVSLTRKASYSTAASAASAIGQSLIYTTYNQTTSGDRAAHLHFARPNDVSLIVIDEFFPSNGIVSVRVSDSSESGMVFSSSANLNVLTHLATPIYIDTSFLPESIVLQQATPQDFHFETSAIESGNIVRAKVTSKFGNVEGKYVVDSKLNINWNGDFNEQDVQYIAFSRDRAVIQNFDGYLNFFKCETLAFN